MTGTGLPAHDYLTVKELAELLRLKERKVYDLAASGAVPCSRATGKLLFPKEEIRAWLVRETTGSAAANARPGVILGSHDPLLDWAIRQSGCGLATLYDGSGDGLARYADGGGIAAGLHLFDFESKVWNVPAAREAASGQGAVLIAFARRSRGLVYRAEAGKIEGLQGLAGRTMIPRQAGSGTERLFSAMLAEAGIDGGFDLGAVARTEDDAVEAVRRGEGDVAFGLEAVARGYGLEFTGLIDEEFALLIERKAFFEPPFQRLLGFLHSDAFTARADSLGGYDVSDLGAVRWND